MYRCVDCGATAANHTPIRHREGCNTDAAKVQLLEAENKKYKVALEKLARLGNEPFLGNSDGNKIAQRALKAK